MDGFILVWFQPFLLVVWKLQTDSLHWYPLHPLLFPTEVGKGKIVGCLAVETNALPSAHILYQRLSNSRL
jgi:hypothetical protein